MKKNKSDKNLFENIKKDSKSFYCKKHFENYQNAVDKIKVNRIYFLNVYWLVKIKQVIKRQWG